MSNTIDPKSKIHNNYHNLDTFFNHSIARNPLSFEVYKEDAEMALEFIFWLCQSISTSTSMEHIKVDPNVVAKELGYKTKSHFHETIPNPFQFEGKTSHQIEDLKQDPHKYVFHTRFENMLYKLFSISLDLHDVEFQGSKRKYIIKKATLIEQLQIFEDTAFKNKKYYVLQTTPFFIENLSRTYVMLNSKNFIACSRTRMKRLNWLYLSLAATQNHLKHNQLPSYEANFDELCKVAGIDHYSNQARKKQKLIQYFNEIQNRVPDMGFQYFFANNGNYNYKPIITFTNNHKYTKGEHFTAKIRLFDSVVLLFMSKAFLKLDPGSMDSNNFSSLFKSWLQQNQLNRPEKQKAYCEAHKLYWNRKIEADHRRVQLFINERKHEFDAHTT